VVDGTGVPRQFADLAIKDGVVERVSGSISASDAASVIGAEGKIVAPGVIDLDYASLSYNRDAFDVVHDLPDGDYRRVCRAEGVEAVYCNGLPIFQNNGCTGELPGRLIGNGAAAVDTMLQSPSLKVV